MNAIGKMAALLVLVGLCLPSYADILVYKLTVNDTLFSEQEGGGWEVDTEIVKAYMVIDLSDADEITQAVVIKYGRDGAVKWYEEDSPDFELVPVEVGNSVRWVVMEKRIELDGETITSSAFYMLTGLARARGIGTAEKRVVPNKLSGYGLDDDAGDGQREIIKATLSATLYPAFTYWANGDDVDEGNQDFDATRDMIREYLLDRGYVGEDE